MGCPLPANKRKVGWEYVEAANALCRTMIGHSTGKTMSRWYWLNFDPTNTDPRLAWSNNGFLCPISKDPASNPQDGWEAVDSNGDPLPVTQQLRLWVIGDQSLTPEQGASNNVTYFASVVFVKSLVPFVLQQDNASAQFTWPTANQTLVFSSWTQFAPTFGGPPVVDGTLTCTPLKWCHECQSDYTNP